MEALLEHRQPGESQHRRKSMGQTRDNSLTAVQKELRSGVRAARVTARLRAQPEHSDTANCWGQELPAFTKTVNTCLRSLSSVLELGGLGSAHTHGTSTQLSRQARSPSGVLVKAGRN